MVAEERTDPYEGVYGLISTAPPPSSSTVATGSRSSHSKAPMLARSRPKGWREIEDEEEKLKFELSARPEFDSSSFERVPIEDFGKAMLLGMGWKPGVNDGAKVVELARRPERLGLGATALPTPPPTPGSKSLASMSRNGRGSSSSAAAIDPRFTAASRFIPDGTRVHIVAGEHEGMLGRIRRLAADEKEYIVELDNDEHVRVGLKEVEIYVPHHSSEDEDEETMVARNTTTHTIIATGRTTDTTTTTKKRQSDGAIPPHQQPPSKRYKAAELLDEYGDKEEEETKKKENDTHHHHHHHHHPAARLWVTPFIRVKVQSKRFKDGKYYCKKGVVEDIVMGTRCTIRLDDGHVIDDIDQADLETVIPGIGGRVMVVRGPDIGIKGVIREKDSNKQAVYVQIDDELDVLKFSMDDVAEYVA